MHFQSSMGSFYFSFRERTYKNTFWWSSVRRISKYQVNVWHKTNWGLTSAGLTSAGLTSAKMLGLTNIGRAHRVGVCTGVYRNLIGLAPMTPWCSQRTYCRTNTRPCEPCLSKSCLSYSPKCTVKNCFNFQKSKQITCLLEARDRKKTVSIGKQMSMYYSNGLAYFRGLNIKNK
jgi:hypothetical protein